MIEPAYALREMKIDTTGGFGKTSEKEKWK